MTLLVDASRGDGTPVETRLEVDAPLDRADARDVVELGPAGRRAALGRLLSSLGLFGQPDLATSLALAAQGLETTISERRLQLLFVGKSDLGANLVSGVPNLWQVSRQGANVEFCLPQVGTIPKGVSWQVDAYLSGLDVTRFAPPPDELKRVDALPALGAKPVVGGGHVVFARWVLPPGSHGAIVPSCAVPAGRPATNSGLLIGATLSGRTRLLVATYDGRWAHVRVALTYLIAALVFLPLIPLGRRSWSHRTTAGVLGVLGLVLVGIAIWVVPPGWESPSSIRVEAPLVVAAITLTLVVLAVAGVRAAVIAGVVAAVAAGSAVWADKIVGSPYLDNHWGSFAAAAWAALVLTGLVFIAITTLTVTLLRSVTEQPVRWLPRRRLAFYTVLALIICAIVAQTASGSYGDWRARHAAVDALRPDLFPKAWQTWATGGLFYLPLTFTGIVLNLLALVAVAAAVALLARLGSKATSPLFGPTERSAELVAILLFAVFVVGTETAAYGWRVPLPLFAAVLLWIPLRRKPADPPPAADGGAHVFLRFGPGKTWWQNGYMGVDAAARLMVVPLVLFVYVVAAQRLRHDVSPWNPNGAGDLLVACIEEVMFWLVAGLVLGMVFPYLPGGRGAIKGLFLAGVYVAATWLGAWLIPGDTGWFFRAFELTLFLVVVGVYLDWRTFKENGKDVSALAAAYRVKDLRYAGGYISGAIGALFVIGQQLQSGNAQNAITQIVKSIPILLPPTH